MIGTVDIGMRKNHGYCTAADGRSSKTFKFENTRQGFDALWTMVLASKDAFGCNEVIVGYESTGALWRATHSLPQAEAGDDRTSKPNAYEEDERYQR